MDNKLIATVDIGSHSCILLIAAFESSTPSASSGTESPTETTDAKDAEPAEVSTDQKVLVPKLQKVEVCRLGEDIYEQANQGTRSHHDEVPHGLACLGGKP